MFKVLTQAFTKGRVSPSTWDPSSALPSGNKKDIQFLKAPISSATSLSFVANGSWAHGTLVFEVSENAHPPTYDAAVSPLAADDAKRRGPQLGDGQGFLEIRVEARWNDDELWSESKTELRSVGGTGSKEIELSVNTPTMSPSRLASQLSYHIIISFPPSISTLSSLRTSGSQWRTLGLPSLTSLHFTTLSISTANTPISFSILNCGSGEVATVNNKIDGTYVSTTSFLKIRNENGTIEGSYTSEKGECSIHTTNAHIKAQVIGHTIVVDNKNAKIEGPFRAKGSLTIDNSNANIEGPFVGSGIKLSTSNASLKGNFTVQDYLVLKTSNANVEANVTVLSGGGGGGEEEHHGPTTPPLLPSYEPVASSSGGGGYVSLGGSGGGGPGGKKDVEVEVKTSNGNITVEFTESVSGGSLVNTDTKTSNANVTVKHRSPFAGTFELSTSNGSPIMDVVPTHQVEYNLKENSKAEGEITTKGMDGRKSGTVKIKTSNGNAKLSVW